MITDTQKGLIDMLRKKGAPQTVGDIEQTLRTLHWTEEDIQDAISYYVTSLQGVVMSATPSEPLASKTSFAQSTVTISQPANTFGTGSSTTFTVPNAFVGGPVSGVALPQASNKNSRLVILIVLLFLFVVLGGVIFFFRDSIGTIINKRFPNAVPEITQNAIITTEDTNTTEQQNTNQSIPIPPPPAEEISTSTRIIPIRDIPQEKVLQNQITEVTKIRKALATYHMLYGVYPNTLPELLNPVDATSIKQNALYPTAVQSGQPLLMNLIDTSVPAKKYTKGNNDYDLEYTVALPPFENVTNPYSFIGIQRFDLATKKILASVRGNKTYHDASYELFAQDAQSFPTRTIVMLLRDGRNTATKHTISKEMWAVQEKDTDGDLLSDSLEAYINSDINKKDTDEDGVNDGEEFKQRKNIFQK